MTLGYTRRTSGLIELEVLGVHAQAERIKAVVTWQATVQVLGRRGAWQPDWSGCGGARHHRLHIVRCVSVVFTRSHSTHTLLERADRVNSGVPMYDSLAVNSRACRSRESLCTPSAAHLSACFSCTSKLPNSRHTRVE